MYHENVFDLMDDRAQLSIGSSKTKMGIKNAGKADIGGAGANRLAMNGVHPVGLYKCAVLLQRFSATRCSMETE